MLGKVVVDRSKKVFMGQISHGPLYPLRERGSVRFLALPNLAVTICNLLPLEFNLMPMLLYWHIIR